MLKLRWGIVLRVNHVLWRWNELKGIFLLLLLRNDFLWNSAERAMGTGDCFKDQSHFLGKPILFGDLINACLAFIFRS